jgi:hypothetical protein
MPVAALVPLIIAAVAWIVFCWRDLSKSDVQYLPKWGWALVIALSVPIGGVLYLTIGRTQT